MGKPLNEYLYLHLKRIFGKVIIANEGQKLLYRYGWHPKKDQEMVIENPGEYYRVCCDRCNDTRFRLYVNHHWGRRDDHGRRNLWLAICYNEGCYDYSAAESLYERVSMGTDRLGHATIHEGVERREAVEVEPPGPIKPLHLLPPDHPANLYLAGRFFDPEYLSRYWGVGYCEQSFYTLARNRIYIPLYQDGKLKGWQCRHIGDMDWKADDAPPKYFSCPDMMRGHVIYNLDRACRYGTGIVTEGPTNPWNIGPMTMATFGFPMTKPQQRIIVPKFADRSIVLLFDPDVLQRPSTKKQFDRIWDELQDKKPRHGIAAVQLPGVDPAELDRGFIRRLIEQEAKAQGVKVNWGRT